MEQKLKVGEFAELVGTSAKTIYKKINTETDNIDERLITVNELVNGRKIQYILTNDAQIDFYKSIYSKLPVNEGNYEDILQVNEGKLPERNSYSEVNFETIINKLLDENRFVNEQLINYNNELVEAKSKVLLLEDKQVKSEGDAEHWKNEYFKLQTENKQIEKGKLRLITFFTAGLITVIIPLVILAVLYFIR